MAPENQASGTTLPGPPLAPNSSHLLVLAAQNPLLLLLVTTH